MSSAEAPGADSVGDRLLAYLDRCLACPTTPEDEEREQLRAILGIRFERACRWIDTCLRLQSQEAEGGPYLIKTPERRDHFEAFRRLLRAWGDLPVDPHNQAVQDPDQEQDLSRNIGGELGWLRYAALNEATAQYARLPYSPETGAARDPKQEEYLLGLVQGALNQAINRRVNRRWNPQRVWWKEKPDVYQDCFVLFVASMRRRRRRRRRASTALEVRSARYLDYFVRRAVIINEPDDDPPRWPEQDCECQTPDRHLLELTEGEKAGARRDFTQVCEELVLARQPRALRLLLSLLFLPYYQSETCYSNHYGLPNVADAIRTKLFWAEKLIDAMRRAGRDMQKNEQQELIRLARGKGIYGAVIDDLLPCCGWLQGEDSARQTLLANPSAGSRVLELLWRFLIGADQQFVADGFRLELVPEDPPHGWRAYKEDRPPNGYVLRNQNGDQKAVPLPHQEDETMPAPANLNPRSRLVRLGPRQVQTLEGVAGPPAVPGDRRHELALGLRAFLAWTVDEEEALADDGQDVVPETVADAETSVPHPRALAPTARTVALTYNGHSIVLAITARPEGDPTPADYRVPPEQLAGCKAVCRVYVQRDRDGGATVLLEGWVAREQLLPEKAGAPHIEGESLQPMRALWERLRRAAIRKPNPGNVAACAAETVTVVGPSAVRGREGLTCQPPTTVGEGERGAPMKPGVGRLNWTNRPALEQVWQHYLPRLEDLIRKRIAPALAPRTDPEGLLSEVFLRAQRHWDRFEAPSDNPDAACYAWLAGIARSALLDEWRHHTRAGRDVRIEQPCPDRSSHQVALGLVDSGPSPSEAAASREREERLADALAALKPRDRDVLHKLYIEGRSVAEVAQEWNMPEGTVRARQARALRRLRDLWQRLYGAEELTG
jgi:RNA polymerase sigma-70 factor (ECF subfamily)